MKMITRNKTLKKNPEQPTLCEGSSILDTGPALVITTLLLPKLEVFQNIENQLSILVNDPLSVNASMDTLSSVSYS